MTHVPHELHEEFPKAADTLHALKTSNAHFRTLAERYEAINHQVFRIESELDAASDDVLEKLKKERLQLKDEIAGMIRDHGHTDA